MSRKFLVPVGLPADPTQPLEAATKQYADLINLWVQSRGQGLVTNGTALMGDNTNFKNFLYNGVESFAGGGSFTYEGPDAPKGADEMIAVDVSRRYRFAYAIKLLSKSVPSETPNHYGWVLACDADRLLISPHMVMKVSGSALTTLAADLNPGATTITLTSATGWHNGATAHMRSIGMWPFTNQQGFTYPDYTYTRQSYLDSANGMWLQNGISGNVITLRVPWAGPAFPAGTRVANMQSGGTYDYIAGSNVATPPDWTVFEGTIGRWDKDSLYSTVDTTVANGMYMSPTGFRWGTAFVQVGWLLSYNTPAGIAKTAVDAVTFELAGSSLAQGAVQRAGDTMTGNLVMSNPAYIDANGASSYVLTRQLRVTNGVNSANSILFGYSGSASYCHAIYTSHNGSSTPANYILFKLWKLADAHLTPTNNVLMLGGDLITAYYPVRLPGNPVNVLDAAPKQYVDAQVAAAPFLTQATADALYVNVAGDTVTGGLVINTSTGQPLEVVNSGTANSQLVRLRATNGQPGVEWWDSGNLNRIGFIQGIQSGAGIQGLLIAADAGGVVRTRVGATDVMTVSETDVATTRLRNAIPAADYWTAASTFFVEGIGWVGTPGSWWMSMVANGYRNTSNTWTTLNANGQVGAAEIDLTNLGTILFRASPSHNNGATPQPPEHMRLIGNATALTGTLCVGKTAVSTQVAGVELAGAGLVRVTRDTTAESIQFTRVGAGNAATSFFCGFRTGASDLMIGSIRANATNDGVNFNTTSHGPWKGDVADIDDDEALETVMLWRPVNYRWKRDDDGELSANGTPQGPLRQGFIAEEMALLEPAAYTAGSGDETLMPEWRIRYNAAMEAGEVFDEPEPFTPGSGDPGALVPRLVAAVQALVRRVAALEARL